MCALSQLFFEILNKYTPKRDSQKSGFAFLAVTWISASFCVCFYTKVKSGKQTRSIFSISTITNFLSLSNKMSYNNR